jgi:DNA-binding transcriptional LysR family regulator
MLHARLLRYLDEVARSGSIRKAANRLNVASSAVNRQILALEQDIGSPIFERMPRGLRLTAAGEMLISHVRQTLKEHERVRARIEALKGLRRGLVTVVTTTGIAGGFLAGVIERFGAAHPGIKLRIQTLPRDVTIAAVVSGEADFALAYNLPNTPRLSTFLRFEYRLGAVMAPDHPLARRLSLRLAECFEYPVVISDRTMSIRDVLESVAGLDYDLGLAMETNSIELMKRLARTSPNITFLNPVDIGAELRAQTLALIPVREIENKPQILSLVYRSRGALDPAANLLANDIQAALEDGGSV